MPFLAPAIIAIGTSIGSALATAGAAIGAAAGSFAAGDLALGAAELLSVGSVSLVGGFTVGSAIELGALAGASALLAPHPKVNTQGSPQAFKPDTNAGIPVIEGRYGVGGNLVYETTSGGGNKASAGAQGNEYLTQFVVLSGLGPVNAVESLRFNDTILTFNGQQCTGGYIPEDEVQSYNPGYKQNGDGSYQNNVYNNHCWQNYQLGYLNSPAFSPPSKLASDNAALTEWTPAHAFSSFCVTSLTIVYDQTVYAGGVPQPQWVVQGGRRYDPRQDSTYPGGNGACRWVGPGASAAAIDAAWGTRVYNTNPIIAALNYALGYFLPDPKTGLGRLYAGIGAGVTGVDIPAFVRAANIADANGWLICGQWTTDDGKWNVLNEMLKAGSASAVIKNGLISCIVDTPLTSLGTVTADDLSGPVKLPTGAALSARINTITPRYSSEAHRWQMVPAAAPVEAQTYVSEDGAVRSKTMDWQYVPAVNQACQLAAYTICNGREIAGIELPGKPKLRNYGVGDCLTVDIPEAGLSMAKVMVTKRLTDPATGGVTLTVRTETDAKHPYSLGLTGVAPQTPGISGYDPTIVEMPLPASWSTGVIQYVDSATSESRSIIQITGAVDSPYAQDLLARYRPVAQVNGAWTPTGSGAWTFESFPATQTQFNLDLNPGSYDVQIAYVAIGGAYPSDDSDWLDLGVETIGGSTAANAAALGGTAAPSIFSQISAAASAASLALTGVADANTSITALTATYGDTASAAASAQAANAASAAATTAQGAAQAAATQAAASQASAASASQGATASQTAAAASAQTAQTQAGNASTSATSAAGSAVSAQGFANTASTQATNAANSATTAAGSATAAQTSAGQASTYAGAASTSASASQAANVLAIAAAAATLPANMALPGTWSASASFPNVPYASTDYHFLTAADGAAVYRSDAAAAPSIVTAGQLTPIVGRTYQVTCVGRFFVTPGSSTVGSKLYADIIGLGSNGAVSALASAGVDSTGTAAGTLVTTTTTWTCTASPAISAIKARAIPNTPNSGTTYSPAQWDLISLRLADITESTLATTQANAAANSASQAAASQSGAAQSASAASTSATNANTYAGNASTSAGQASTSASQAASSATSAGTYATNSANSATASGNSASASNSSATAASSSASAASSSASSAQSFSQSASTSATNSAGSATNASNSAGSASTSAVAASNSAAAAQQSYYLAASVGSGALNANATFASYAGTGSMPSGWQDDSYATGASSMVAGFDSPNAIYFNCTGSTYGSQSVQISQRPGTAGAAYGLGGTGGGWYVLELDINVRSQSSATSAGAYLLTYPQANGGGTVSTALPVCFGATPDSSGSTGVVTGRRQYAVLGQIASCASLGVAIQPNGYGGVYAASQIEVHRCKLRPASSAEIAGQQAYVTANTNTAALSNFQSAQTSQNSAFSTSINSLNAAVFNASGGSLQSQITNNLSAQANQNSTFASSLTTLQARTILGQNLVGDGGLANGGAGWIGKPQAVYVQPPYPGRLGYVTGITASAVSMETGQFGVVAGTTYTATANIQASLINGSGTVTCALNVAFFNASGSNLGKDASTSQATYSLSATGPNATLVFAAPTGAVTAVLYVYTVISNGSSPSVTQYASRLKCEPGASYTGWSDDASQQAVAATVTASSAAIATLQGQLFATYTLTATAGNVITGLQLLSASGATSISAVIFQAESFFIKSASASSSISPFYFNSKTGTLSLQNIVVTNAVIGTAAIGTLNLVGGAVNQFFQQQFTASGSGQQIAPGGGGAAQSVGTPSTPTNSGGAGSGGNRGQLY